MKAVVYDRYGPPDVLRLTDVERPVPGDDELLVKVRAATVTRSDVHTREANRSNGLAVMTISRLVSGWSGPRQRILGTELAGEVVALGASVRNFALGDEVFGNTGFRFGCHAEYVRVPANRAAPKPVNATFEESAPTTDGPLNCLWCFRNAQLRTDESILVYGASGSIGTAGVQLAVVLGAHVTGVCATKNVELVRSLGAEDVIDYLKDDFSADGKTYDVIFDAVGRLAFGRCKASLKPGGRYIATDHLSNVFLGFWTGRFGDKKVIFPIPPRYQHEDLVHIKALIEAGKYRAVIDRRYPLEQVVEATTYVESAQKTGNVVLTL